MPIALSYSARMNHTCPRCKARPGDYCSQPSGRRYYEGVGGVHAERLACCTEAEQDAAQLKLSMPWERCNKIVREGVPYRSCGERAVRNTPEGPRCEEHSNGTTLT